MSTTIGRVNANINIVTGGSLECAHCSSALDGDAQTVLDLLPRREGPASAAGPHICADPSAYIDAEVVFRQYYCPSCWTAFHSEVVLR